MQVDPITLLFENIPEDLVPEMYTVAEDIILLGKFPHPVPDWMEEWLQVGQFDSRQILLVGSTVLPARIALSLLRQAGFKRKPL